MPYIKQNQRIRIDKAIDGLVTQAREIPEFDDNKNGIFNYVITRLACQFVGKESYKNHSEMLSAMDNAAREYYRRKVAPYEDEKMTENGDVY